MERSAATTPDVALLNNYVAARVGRVPDAVEALLHASGPVHHVDAGRYYAKVVDGVPMIFRADTAGAVLEIESHA